MGISVKLTPGTNNQPAPAWLQQGIAWVSVAENRAKFFRYMRGVQLAAGLLFLFLGWTMGKMQIHLIQSGSRTVGRIVAYQPRSFRSSSGRDTFQSTGYMPVVEYRLDGDTVRFEDWLGSSRAGPLNANVMVLYDPANPKVAMIDRPMMNWIPWLPVLGVGAFLILAGMAGLLRSPTK
jgi:hypothetical protein